MAQRDALASYALVLDAVRGMGWPALRRVRSAVPGPHLSRVRGTSAEVVEYRGYRQGDDPKRIDWKLVGRTNRVYVRVSHERALLPTTIVLDASGSMAFPPDTHDKWELARRLAIGLASVARHGGDPVGLSVVAAGGTRVVAPRTRRTVLEEMMTAADVVPSASAPVAPAFADAARQSARVVLITDFLAEGEALLREARSFVARGGELYAIHVVDALELEPDRKKLLLVDPEDPALRRPMSLAARAIYVKRFSAWRAELAREWRRAGAVYVMVVPQQESIRQMVRRITGGPTAARNR